MSEMDWPEPSIFPWGKQWRARMYVATEKGHLQFDTFGDTPDEAQAHLEKLVIETMAQG